MRFVRRLLARCVALVVLLPIAVLVIVGLTALLHGLGDPAGARVCGRLALFGGVVWVVAVIAMALVTAVAVVGPRPPPAPGREWRRMRREGGRRDRHRRGGRRGGRGRRGLPAAARTGDDAEG